jgi:hypothetical protein
MAELWNTGIRLANTKRVIVLNEDLAVSKDHAKECIDMLESNLLSHGLVILNDSFGHFGVTKTALIDANWFDERFLGFGEEDGDFLWRYENTTGTKPKYVYHPGLSNVASSVGYELIASSKQSKYSSFNYEFLRVKFKFGDGPAEGLFSKSAEERVESPKQYPHERFRDALGPLVVVEEPRQTLAEKIEKQL